MKRMIYRKENRYVKGLFFQNSIQDAGSDSVNLWKTLKCLLQNSTKRDNITQIDRKTDPIEIVDALNIYFSNIGKEVTSILPSKFELNLNRTQRWG